MRYAKYILKLKNLYMFYTTYILPGPVDVLGIYLRYDNIGDILLQNVVTLVDVQVILVRYMRTGREFKRIVWICSFLEFPTRSHITYDSWIWLIFGSCLQSAGIYLRYCHIYGIYCISYGISYIYLLILENIHGIYLVYDISKYIYLVWHAYPIDMTFHKKIIEHVYVISIGYTRIKILILCI